MTYRPDWVEGEDLHTPIGTILTRFIQHSTFSQRDEMRAMLDMWHKPRYHVPISDPQNTDNVYYSEDALATWGGMWDLIDEVLDDD